MLFRSIHRIGRTGRAGRTGKAVLLVRTNQIRMLRTIERVTKSSMQEIQLPARDKVAEARLSRLGAELAADKESESLEAFAELITKLQETLEVDSTTIAAMLLKRQQGKRPLFYKGPDPMIAALEREKQRRERRGERGERRGERGERRSYNDADFDTYQLQVGREQGVQVKDIVGALANELGFTKGSIGAIKLAPEHTFVQLPKKMTADVAAQLKKLRIRQNEVKAVVVEGVDLSRERPRGNRDGNRGGYRGNREGGNGRRDGERRFDRNRGGDNRGSHRGERNHNGDRPRRPRRTSEA